jgi:hypothetical protein
MIKLLFSAAAIASAHTVVLPLRLSSVWTITAAALMLFVAPPASAQGTAQERSACMGDAFRFCSSDIPFVSEIEACLEQNMRRLSRACRHEFLPRHKTKLREEHFR